MLCIVLRTLVPAAFTPLSCFAASFIASVNSSIMFCIIASTDIKPPPTSTTLKQCPVQDDNKYLGIDKLFCRINYSEKRSAPSKGSKTLASPSTTTCGASGRTLPQEIASLSRAPDREPSCSGAVVIPTAESNPSRY